MITFALHIVSLEYGIGRQIINTVSFICLTGELTLKILAFGFFNKKNGFFLNSWNFFDFTLWSLILVFTFIRNEKYPINFTYYRIFHILKLLKVKEYVYLLAGIFSSFKAIVNFLLIISIFLIFFSISSTFLFSGVLERKCYAPNLGLNTNHFCFEKEECLNDNYICSRLMLTNPDNGMTNFDTYLYSLIQIIRIITFASFSYITILMEQAFSGFLRLYFVGIGIFGNFFFINLILAVLKVKYTEYKEKFINNQKIPEFSLDIQTKTFDLREAQSKGILLKQKLKHTRRFLQKFLRDKTCRKLFLEKGRFYISVSLLSQNKSFSSGTPYSGKTPIEYRNVKKTSNTPLSSCLKKNMDQSSAINAFSSTPNKIENVTDFIKKSRLSIKKNRAFDLQSPELSVSPYRKSVFRANNKHLTELTSRANRMFNFHQIFVNRIVKRENNIKRMKKNEEESSSSQIDSSKSNAFISTDDLKTRENSLFAYMLVKLLRFFQNKFQMMEKKVEGFYGRKKIKPIDAAFLSKRIKTELPYESDSAEEVLPTM